MSEEQNLCAEYRPRLSLFVTTLVDKNAAVAEVGLTIETIRDINRVFPTPPTFVETGSSKRDKGDQFDRGLGEQFAVARALVKLGKAIERDAAKKVARLTPAAPVQDVPAEEAFVLDHNPGYGGHNLGSPWWGWRA